MPIIIVLHIVQLAFWLARTWRNANGLGESPGPSAQDELPLALTDGEHPSEKPPPTPFFREVRQQ
jgi:hypothetical protein